ncbi:GntR family transcriptional regulator [Aneurinibacillus sp. Ricciae_BoGa-3]|uniref:GntR family transcriptional regulator n=1 Tax=Aneurinibacillus sp. Ricciae_BoGa-3 TaxID=3022697 RepID=UPI002340F9DC|nr:GntR family transcriptional regulator [Aneurinibacillus sp. Ricciae_BoGa-3]WCK56626.1 GntR family transcriptional regulator [Aneurinibacillus sp. Ricciae_BoGa-3]
MQRTVSHSALSNLIKESITEDIMRGRLRSGDKLIEAKYAEEFGTSRAPIREAFYLLTLEGIAKKIPRKGTVVQGYSREEIGDVLAIRGFIEDLALQRIKQPNIADCLNTLDEIVNQMEHNLKDKAEYARLNYNFHYQFILASENEVINDLYTRIGAPLLSLQTMSFIEEQSIRNSYKEHRSIIGHLRSGDIEQARKQLQAHNNAVLPRIAQHFTE